MKTTLVYCFTLLTICLGSVLAKNTSLQQQHHQDDSGALADHVDTTAAASSLGDYNRSENDPQAALLQSEYSSVVHNQRRYLRAQATNACPTSLPWPITHIVTAHSQGMVFEFQNAAQTIVPYCANNNKPLPTITLDETTTFQTMQGFGYTLTGGSAQHLMTTMTSTDRTALLQELFGLPTSSNPHRRGISVLRLSMGSSDLDAAPFTYDDDDGSTTADPNLVRFSLAPDRVHVIPLLQQILAIRPDLQLLATPWTAPTWMKDNHGFMGGSLLPQYYPSYANYFVKYLQAMQTQEGIIVHAISIQNEPLHDGNNPSMIMTDTEQAVFIQDYLAPALGQAGLATKIVIYDHNADNIQYPLSILNTPTVKPYVYATAFHLYGGSIHSLSTVHDVHPDKEIWFTEQFMSSTSNSNMNDDLLWHAQNVLIGAARNWATTILEWNLSSNPTLTPFTDGGCSTCLGAVTIGTSGSVTRHAAYYLLAHASTYVPPGSVRMASSDISSTLGIHNVAFRTLDGGRIVVILANTNSGSKEIVIRLQSVNMKLTVAARSLSTIVFDNV